MCSLKSNRKRHLAVYAKNRRGKSKERYQHRIFMPSYTLNLKVHGNVLVIKLL
jgi:hypothetical protein